MIKLTQLLDNGYGVILYKNALGSYTAETFTERNFDGIKIQGVVTDDFTPEAAIKRLADKVTNTGEYPL